LAQKEVGFEMKKNKATDQQVGGDHYKKYKIQPIEFMIENNIPYAEGSAMLYILRWKDKGNIQDLEKAIHTCELIKQVAKEGDKPYAQKVTERAILDSLGLNSSFDS
jgi:hypothetical protein